MSNWKDLAIGDLIALQSQKKLIEKNHAEDVDIQNAALLMTKALDKIKDLEQPYNDALLEINTNIESLQKKFVDAWDTPDKTYECKIGTATLRTTKSLIITRKAELITLLTNIGKLPECIRSWNLSYLRKLKDVDMIDETIAYYEEHKNIIVKGVSAK
jgi:hypothetical protein